MTTAMDATFDRRSSLSPSRLGDLWMPAPAVLMSHLVILLAGALYTEAVVAPSLKSDHYRDGYYLADSYGYAQEAPHFHFSSLFHGAPVDHQGLFPSFGLTNSLLYFEQNIATAMSRNHGALLVFFLNYGILVAAVYCISRLARQLKLAFTPDLQLLVVANPMIWLNLVSLTKEVWGLFFVSVFALACIQRRVRLLLIAALASMLAREWYLATALAMAAVSMFRVSALRLLVAVSLLIGAAAFVVGAHDITGFSDTRSLDLGQRSAHIMASVASLQHYPFGQIVAFPIVLAFDLSPWLNSHQWNAIAAPYVAANVVSSILFCVLIGLAIRRHGWRPAEPHAHWLGRVLVAFAIVVTLYPISQHRYLTPAWPLVVLLLARPLRRAPNGVARLETR